jgi:hypothetical protein
MGCVKLHILDEQYKCTELKVSYRQKELTPNFCAENLRSGMPINRIDPSGLLDDWYENANGEIKWTDYKSQAEMNSNGVQGKYLGQAVVQFNGARHEKLGTKNGQTGYINGEGARTASVTVYGKNGADDIHSFTGYTMTSNPDVYGAINEGTYNGNYMNPGKGGSLSSNWALNGGGNVPTMDNKPNYNPEVMGTWIYGTPNKNGIYIHSANSSGYASGNVSTGCLLISPNDWNAFNSAMSGVSNFSVQVRRQQIVNVPLQGVTGIVPNMYIPKLNIRK